MTPPSFDPLDAREDHRAAPCCSGPSHMKAFLCGWDGDDLKLGPSANQTNPQSLRVSQGQLWPWHRHTGMGLGSSNHFSSWLLRSNSAGGRPVLHLRAEENSGRSVGPGEQWPSSGLLSDLTSLTGNVAAVFRGSTGRQCRTVVDKGSSWIRSRVLDCPRRLFVTWAVAAGPREGSSVRMASSKHPYFFSDPSWIYQS